MKNLVSVHFRYFKKLLAAINPLKKKRRLPGVAYQTYTRDVLKNESFKIGEYTDRTPKVIGVYPSLELKLKIGGFCSIAPGVVIMLHGID